VQYLALAFLGGIGFILGPVVGAILTPGALGSEFGSAVVPGLGRYLGLIGGVTLVLMVLTNQDGVLAQMGVQARWVTGRVPRLAIRAPRTVSWSRWPGRKASGKGPAERAARVEPDAEAPSYRRVEAKTLEVRGVSVRYGAVTALSDVSLEVKPGRITGLIGPNGAGKTTLIDAITGFTRPDAGSLFLNGEDLAKLSPMRRARAGIGRSFQSLELFEDMTVLENIHAASDSHDWRYGVTDLVRPSQSPFGPELAMVVSEFQLEGDLATPATALPYGRRRLLAIARAVAGRPSVLLLDEPAAGLSGVELRELAAVVRRLAADWGIAVLLIEHDMEFVFETCDELVAIDFGRKIASGSPEEIRRDQNVISAYLGTRDVATTSDTATQAVVE
jgi:sulfate-transporting ATPase